MIAYFDGEQLTNSIALVLAAVFLPALEAQTIRAPELAELPFATKIIRSALGSINARLDRCRRDCRHR